jgi:polyisoprenoid-binding protein YceI
MSKRVIGVPALAAVLSVGLAAGARQAAAQAGPGLDFTVSGTSTIRGWTCTVRGALAVTPGGGKPVPGFAGGVQTATVTVQVKAFSCPEDEMKEHLLQAMKADRFSEIVFRLERYDVTGNAIQASGSMTIAGTTQPVSFPIALRETPQGVQVDGSTQLNMTAYGVDPPVVMLGLLKVAPQIRIAFKGVVPAAK